MPSFANNKYHPDGTACSKGDGQENSLFCNHALKTITEIRLCPGTSFFLQIIWIIEMGRPVAREGKAKSFLRKIKIMDVMFRY